MPHQLFKRHPVGWAKRQRAHHFPQQPHPSNKPQFTSTTPSKIHIHFVLNQRNRYFYIHNSMHCIHSICYRFITDNELKHITPRFPTSCKSPISRRMGKGGAVPIICHNNQTHQIIHNLRQSYRPISIYIFQSTLPLFFTFIIHALY